MILRLKLSDVPLLDGADSLTRGDLERKAIRIDDAARARSGETGQILSSCALDSSVALHML